MEKESILIKNIKFLVTCDENDQVYSHVNMYIEKGKISYIGSEGRKAKTIIDGTNFVVYPGLINTCLLYTSELSYTACEAEAGAAE